MYVAMKYLGLSVGGLFSDAYILAPWSFAKFVDLEEMDAFAMDTQPVQAVTFGSKMNEEVEKGKKSGFSLDRNASFEEETPF